MTPIAELDKPLTASTTKLTVADAVWVGMALLHRESGTSRPFSTEDIAHRVETLHLTDGNRKSIWQHVNQHCVANRKAQPNRSCMLFATGEGNRRLFRRGDHPHPDRVEGKTHPDWEKLPAEYASLRQWYEQEWNGAVDLVEIDPLLGLMSSSQGAFGPDGTDAYVKSLRDDWGRYA